MTYPPPPQQPGQQPAQPGQPSYPQSGYPQSGQPYQQPGQPYPQPGQPYAQQHPGAPVAPGGAAPRLRGRITLRLSLIFGVVGLALVIVGAVIIGTQSLSKINGFSRVSLAAGNGTAHFASAGDYLAYYEASNVSSGIKSVPLPGVALRSPSGKVLVLNTLYGGEPKGSGNIKTKLTYDYNGHKGVAIYQFTAPEAGTYQVAVRGSGSEAPGADIAFGKSIGKSLALGAGLLVPGILLIIVAVILLIIGLVQRSNSRKQLAGAPYGAPPPGYGYPPQPPQPQAGWQQPQQQQPPSQQPQQQPPPRLQKGE